MAANMSGPPLLGDPVATKIHGGAHMPKFMVKTRYTPEGIKGLRKDKASGREKAVAAACEAMGGKLDALYYALGEDDAVTIVDLPSLAHAASLALAIGSSGMCGVQTVALLTVAEMDKALAEDVKYRPPGG
jgi:uncharacterized protein with GYD domain